MRASCEFCRVTGSLDRERGYVGRREEGDGVAESAFGDGKVGREANLRKRVNSRNEELARRRRGGADHASR